MRASAQREEKGEGPERQAVAVLPEGLVFSVPYMVSVGGATVLLLCLLVIGHIVQPGSQTHCFLLFVDVANLDNLRTNLAVCSIRQGSLTPLKYRVQIWIQIFIAVQI